MVSEYTDKVNQFRALLEQAKNECGGCEMMLVVAGGGLGDQVITSAIVSRLADACNLRSCMISPAAQRITHTNSAVEVLQGHPAGPVYASSCGLPRELLIAVACEAKVNVLDWRHVTMVYWKGEQPQNYAQWARLYDGMPQTLGELASWGVHFEEVFRMSSELGALKQKDYYVNTADTPASHIAFPYAVVHAEPAGLPNHKGFWWQAEALVSTMKEAFPRLALCQIGARHDRTLAGMIDQRGLSVPDTSLLIKRAALFIGCDSGPMYIAHAHCVPSILFFGPTHQSFFAWEENLNLQYPTTNCPPCWFSGGDWHWECKIRSDHCVNMPHWEDEEVVKAIGEYTGRSLEAWEKQDQ